MNGESSNVIVVLAFVLPLAAVALIAGTRMIFRPRKKRKAKKH